MIRDKNNRKNEFKNLDLGELLRNHRVRKGYTLKKMAEITELSPTYLNRIELKQRKNVSMETLFKISKGLDIPIEYLIKVHLPDEEINNQEIKTIEELLIFKRFKIKEKIVDKKKAEKIVEIIENISDFSWDKKERNMEIMNLLNLVDEFKS